MQTKELVKRYGLFIVSLFFAALGVAVTKRGELGVSPISSMANVLSCKFAFLSLGTWLILWNCALIVGQVILLRKEFQLIQLLQIPLYRLWNVVCLLHTGSALCRSACTCALRHFDSWIRRVLVSHCKCDYEFRRGICKSNFR